MATHGEGRNWLARSGPGALAVVVLGALLGYHLSGDIFEIPVRALVINYVLGVVWAFLFLEWVDAIQQGLGFFSDPVPRDLDLGRRDALREHIAKLTGLKELVARSRHLLEAWVSGYKPRDLLALASFQSERARAQLRPGGLLVFLLLIPCIRFYRDSLIAWGALAALALTFYIRNQLLGRIDHYLEVRLLARLPAQAPGTAVTATELGDILGKAVDSAFKNYIPRPEQMAEAIGSAVEKAGRGASQQLEQVQKAFLDSQASLLEKVKSAESEVIAPIQAAQMALAAVSKDLTGGFRTGTDKLNDVLKGHSEQLKGSLEAAAARIQDPMAKLAQQIEKSVGGLTEQVKQTREAGNDEMRKTLTQHAQQVTTAGTTWKDQLQSVMTDHAAKMQQASDTLAAQLTKIAEIEKDIQKVLHVQEVVDGTIKTVTAAEEFQKTLTGLRTHLEESDKLLREAAKPRTIRLVEMEGDVKEG
ncbi:MAG: hypothetical protein JXB04_01265 [Kiritimatiellae bacterium]|nr:hypothetical protein [Kiritimatiellia bacterium]